MRKRIITLSAALAALGLIGAGALSAQAHDGAVEATCTGGLTINLTNYPNGSTIGGTIDGEPYDRTEFDGSYSDTITWTPTVNHEYNLSVTSGDGDINYDRTFSAAVTNCVPTPTEPPATQTPTPPVTETPKPTPTTPTKPGDQVVVGSWVDQRGSENCVGHVVLQVRATTTTPFVLVDGTWVIDPDPAHSVITTEERTRPMTDAEVAACTPTTPPSHEPTTPPTHEPTAPPVTNEPTAPASTPAAVVPPQNNTPTPDTKPVVKQQVKAAETGTLAFTGSQINPWVIAFAALAIASGIALLVVGPHLRRRFQRR